MRFMILVEVNINTEAGVMPEELLVAPMAEYHEKLVNSDVLLDASGRLVQSNVRIRLTIHDRGENGLCGPNPHEQMDSLSYDSALVGWPRQASGLQKIVILDTTRQAQRRRLEGKLLRCDRQVIYITIRNAK